MKSNNPIVRGTLIRAALLTVIATTHAAEQVVDSAATNLTVAPGDTVWFDSANTNAAIPLGTINGAVPATGPLPGWAHTRWSFLKYDGANVVEIPDAEKVLTPVNLASATATSTYYDSTQETSFAANQSIGRVETTRDFLISNGATLDVAAGGLIFHNNSHWMKVGTGSGFLTSSSGQLAVIANGGGADYQINGVVVKDFNGTTPLAFVKTGPDHLNVNGANTYTGGTWINNGRLRASNVQGYGPSGTVKITGTNSQACLAAAGTFPNNFEIQGLGWTEGAEQRGAIRFEASASVGSVKVTDLARIAGNTGVTGTINGTLTGSVPLEVGIGGSVDYAGTLTLNGSAAAMTGPISVSSGRLNVNSALGGSVFVLQGASLGGEGTIAGDLESGGTPASTLVVDGSTTGALAVAGNVDLSFGTTNIAVTGVPASGTSFTAFTYTTPLASVANLAAPDVRGGTVTNDPGNSRVLVNYAPGTINWTGTTNANWTQNADLNFENGSPTNFFNGDKVSFTEAAAVKSLTMVGMLYPGSVTFNNTSEYTVLGPNAGIGGTTGITKNGTGTLNLNGQASNFTGPVAINGGVLKYGTHYEALGYNSGVTIASGAQLDFNGNFPVVVGRSYVWTISGSGPDGLGAITNSSATDVQESAGIRILTLAADASVGSNAGRFDIGLANGTNSTLTGNGHTLTKVGTSLLGFRADASGSPINIVIAGGAAWAENSDAAFGGAGGTLRIKSGARGGTYGIRSIATPVTLESGATLHNQGGGTGTWTGTVTLAGDATIESGTIINVTGAVNGAFSLTKTGAAQTTLADNHYTGNTTVNAGILSLGKETLGDSSTVAIVSAGASKLDLSHGQTDTIGSLLIDGVSQPVGVYGSTESGAPIIDDAHFSGTGRLNVTTTGSAYQAWAALNGIPGVSGAVDSDGDGIVNAIEFVLDGLPLVPDANGLKPTISTADPTYVDFVFRRTDESASSDPYVEYGSNLVGWTKAEPGVNGVLINEANDFFGTGVDKVTVRLPRTLASGQKLFARLAVDIP